MGDTGSFGLGGALAAMAVFTKTEFLLVLIGGIFVIEALSVAIQVIWFKLTGKRVFLMAPIHHHFEMLEWTENKIIVRFWIAAAMFGASGFVLYYLAYRSSGDPRAVRCGRPAPLGAGGVRGDRPLSARRRGAGGRPGRRRGHRRLARIGVEWVTGRDDVPVADATALIKSPGVPGRRRRPCGRRAPPACPCGARSSWPAGCCANPIVGITGTNGKTTTTELIGAMLRAGGLTGGGGRQRRAAR